MAGLAPQIPPQTLRQGPDHGNGSIKIGDDTGSVTIDLDAANDEPQSILIENPDGSVTVQFGEPDKPKDDGKWFGNLATKIGDGELGRIAEDLLRGVEDDLASRKEWIEARSQGMKLLGLTVEIPNVSGANDGAPVEGMSRVRHSLLLESVLRFQANARSELLPTDGPVKIRNDDNNADLKEDQQANALEEDLNHFLTVTASEYYPDTDRMLLMLGAGGTAFKKVYFCPLRNRPVSETVDADDLIVNAQATDLENAKRTTHRVFMRPSTVKRLQILGVYREIPLSEPHQQTLDSVKRERAGIQGVQPEQSKPEDRDREIYEIYTELDIVGFEHKIRGKETGLELPYRVTIDLSTRQVLSIVRNYDKDSGDLPTPKMAFVKYTYVPGFGFYDIGLIHILGNTTNALTAAVREMLDNGMFANFPGFLVSKSASRQNTNLFRVPAGGGAQIDTMGMPINQAIMPLPYNTQQMPALMSLVEALAQDGQRLGGTSELQVGEGRPDAPVGTTLAMIEQATKIENSVHKRMHASQAEEFRLLVECFREHPESFWQRKGRSGYPWDDASFLAALDNFELTPQADPNTASHSQRIMKVAALMQLSGASPDLYDPIAIHTAALQTLGWSNPQQFFVPPSAMGKPPPQLEQMQAKIANDGKKADASLMAAQAKMAEVQAKSQGGGQQQDTPVDEMMAKAKMLDAHTNARGLAMKQHELSVENENRDKDREAKERESILGFARDVAIKHVDGMQAVEEAKRADEEAGRGLGES